MALVRALLCATAAATPTFSPEGSTAATPADGTCEAASAAGGGAIRASAMLQRTTKLATTAAMGASHDTWLNSLLAGSEVSAVHAEVAEGGRNATVSFTHRGQQWEYRLSPFSVYSAGAKAVVHTAKGESAGEPHESEPPRTFRAREAENLHGLWASASMGVDGSVTGLFQVADTVVRLRPFDEREPALASLFEAAKGTGNPHYLQDLDLGRFFRGGALAQQQRPRVSDTGGDVPIIPDDAIEQRVKVWRGTKWWPGCYKGDSQLHEMKIGVVVDEDAFREHGDATASRIQAMFAEASFVYEHQLNIRLSIGYQKIYTSTQGAPNYAKGCNPVLKLDAFTARAARDIPRGMAASHLFTGCGNGRGMIGVAWIGTLCQTDGYNTGINQFHRVKDWLTFAHELGHNLNADHSFEEGEGRTGGIMDYGDGLLNGAYQFNTKYRKGEMCREMNSVVGRCRGGFDPAHPTGPEPPQPTGAPAECKDKHWKCKQVWANKCWKYKKVCPLTCNACPATGPATPKPTPPPGGAGGTCPAMQKKRRCTGGTSTELAGQTTLHGCKDLCASAGAGCCTYYSKHSWCRHMTGSYTLAAANNKYYTAVCQAA